MIKDAEKKDAKAKAKAAPARKFNYDLERMKQAVEAPTVVMPRGLSREAKMRFLMGEDD